jgi:hypothetical protein
MAMFRRFRAVWISLLLVLLAGGYYVYGVLAQPGEVAQAGDAAGVANQPYLQFWMDRLGPDTSVSYHLQFSCGHEAVLTAAELAASGLDQLVDNFDQVVRTMQVESQVGQMVTLSASVPVACPDCRGGYLITELDGCVAVYRGTNKATAVLIQRYDDMLVAALPEDVQQRVREGIRVKTETELARALEGLDG